MKTFGLSLAIALSLAALAGVLGALAWHPQNVTQASYTVDTPAAPLALPPPYLSDANAADAPYGPAPTVDGRIAPGEYAIAHKLTFPTYGGNLEVFIRQDAITLYIAFDSADTIPYPFYSGGGTGPAFQVFLDTQHDRSTLPQTDDYRLTVQKNGNSIEHKGDGSGWGGMPDGRWTVEVYTAPWGWQGEFAIALSKLGITQTGPVSIGLALAEVWTPSWPHDWYWPSTGFYLNPSTWGHLASSSDWSTFYWKPGPWEDYAPSGMPDFDQRQDGWLVPGPGGQPLWTHCGPVAAANSLWWFDSKMETPGHTPPTISDTYPLIQTYGAWDDHYISNTVPLVNDLATYFGTNQGITGTNVVSMFYGLQSYLRDRGLWDDYIVTLVPSPTFQWVADEVMRSEDVILLLGFYQQIGQDVWRRVGGHFVSVAGVDPGGMLTPPQIAFSDPFVDNAEGGRPGRVLSGTLVPHQPIPGHSPNVHNDAGNVSHDVYLIMPTNSPGGIWGPVDYPWTELEDLIGANPHPWIPTEPFQIGPSQGQVEVEFALAVSPYTWKASGYQDYAPNGVPDFDQKQDNWKNQMTGQWSFCGPAAAANSLWWFDSKFETQPITPLTYNDNYPLVKTYSTMPSLLDDHQPGNVDGPAAWPAVDGLIEDLAQRFNTDGSSIGPVQVGTVITDLYTGLISYTFDHGLRQGYVFTWVQSPEFWWVAEEVERSEDVILLLGFYLSSGGPVGERVGGHYVTVPGVDKKGGLIAFSDPFWNRAEVGWPYALPGGRQWMGRVANGVLLKHAHGAQTDPHNDAGNLSHDVYRAASISLPVGPWGPVDYVRVTDEITNFVGANGGGVGGPVPGQAVQTEVEWAIAMSPVADVWIAKTVTPTIVTPGQWVTFTLVFSNAGNTAENIVISDVLSSRLISPTYTYTLNYTGTLTGHDAFTWTVGTLRWNEGGIITITARVDPSATWPGELVIINTAEITTTTEEQYQVRQLPNSASAALRVQTADLQISKSVFPTRTLTTGDWLTFTLVYSNVGPAAATGVVITDQLAWQLITATASFTYTTSYGGMLTASDHYVWQAGTVPGAGQGIITITAQISRSLGTSMPNLARITGWFDRDPSNDQATINVPLTGSTVYLPIVMKNYP